MAEIQYVFKSDQFTIEPGEDEEVNPGCYGKSLAQWLSSELERCGYDTEVIPEDWGWCVMCERGQYLLWVGCGNFDEASASDAGPAIPDPTQITWLVFSEIEIPFFMLRSRLRKWTGRLDLKTPKQVLDKELDRILKGNPRLRHCEEP